MSRQPHQKLKLLYLAQYFLKETDEEHPVTIRELIAYLKTQDVSAERKSLYDDIDALRTFGLDIIQQGGARYATYYLGNRDFELPELKLMVDSIQTAKFLTEKKTASLIRKVESLASVHDAEILQRQVFITGRNKRVNESIYYHVDSIHTGILQNRQIRFHYFDYSVKKEQILRRNGDFYQVSPYAMTWDDEDYYLIAYDTQAAQIKHYRVDKMADIQVTEEPRDGREAYENLDTGRYTRRIFSMFTGDVRQVQLRFENRLIGAVLDRFGKETIIREDGPDHFRCQTEVAVSPQFFAWIFAFGNAAEILGPRPVKEQMRRMVSEVIELYGRER